ncbi:type II toxin-antitoxin system prevent-host-death family antitoxin [Crocosphaera sp. UHCC 0190]|uniref:type II toxin-antitoxin system prevent-host-death family antitoxin n=1 Tax=Crocosphaera sp. UHCC 0190 TaxID=3110246 RepID=UPI002B21129B|nr:type II toxin-antitoxin system prevent-host-death family antitoxin [Crocosphaera sp. UHCC 0190]MEA5511493.1 type II toxin-antitoxin system prevent-host-death family antitoxin [Crocosphaera sp. UHCC 0190]
MGQFSLSEVQKDFANIIDKAQKESIIVKKNDDNYVAIISMKDYEDLVKLKNSRLIKLAQDMGKEAQENGLTPEILQDILNNDT